MKRVMVDWGTKVGVLADAIVVGVGEVSGGVVREHTDTATAN